eukprot:COSAG05_NODE_1342_length_5140_cov_2.897838_8_plen_60_part_00
MTVHTVIVCFCEDEKYNDGGADQPYFMGGSLEEVLGPAAKFGKVRKLPHAHPSAHCMLF